jgi:nicotinamidase-related amidase
MTATPILVLIDVQREYATEGRPFFLDGIVPSLEACRRLLAHARAQGWEVAHVRHEQDKEPFKAGSEHTRFVAGFEPRRDEPVFVKSKLSAFTSEGFAEYAQRAQEAGRRLVVAGYGGTMCCLSTAVEGLHRGVRVMWVRDASLSRASAPESEAAMHAHVSSVMRVYADVVVEAQVTDGSLFPLAPVESAA